MPPTEKRQRVEDTRVYPKEDKEVSDVSVVVKKEEIKPETPDATLNAEASANAQKSAPSDTLAGPQTNTRNDSSQATGVKRKSKTKLVARPFVIMRGHTAFLTFATSGNTLNPKPS